MTEEQSDLKVMLEKAEEKLEAAGVLFDNQHWEDAASRAYYAAFHAVSAVLKSKGLSYSSHGQTIGAFNKHLVNTNLFPKEFGRMLNKMQRDREAGDYRTKSEIGEDIAREDIKFAEKILLECKKFLSIK